MPTYNSEKYIGDAIKELQKENEIIWELIIIDDFSKLNPKVRYLNTDHELGYGIAVKRGLEAFTGQSAVIVMADGSENPSEIVSLYRKLAEGYDCAFGDRFSEFAISSGLYCGLY